jgi:hypothetical protein
MKLRGLSPNSTIHVSVNDLYIPTIGLPIALQENISIDHRYMNVEIGMGGCAVSFLGVHKSVQCSILVPKLCAPL